MNVDIFEYYKMFISGSLMFLFYEYLDIVYLF